jgi:hypothetical protein
VLDRKIHSFAGAGVMDELQLAISQYIDGELTEEEIRQLSDKLQTDVDSVDHFVWNSYIHHQLLEWMDHDRMPLEAEAVGNEELSIGITPAIASKGWAKLWSAIAASLLVAASISIVSYVLATRSVYVGQLSDAAGCKWGSAERNLPIGSMLESGQQLDLVEGNAVITFSSGAKVMLEGPASLRVDSPKEVTLISGLMAAKVPRQAVGFKVETTLAHFIDLGTQFTIDIKPEKSFELHVFEGMVEVRVDKRFGPKARRPAYIAEVHAISFDIKSGDVAKLQFQAGKQMPF